ncbi:MAG: holo-ACP synthase [Clostridiales bacterium]|nr:holo-ACP synthase [Clostridiales bacterium]
MKGWIQLAILCGVDIVDIERFRETLDRSNDHSHDRCCKSNHDRSHKSNQDSNHEINHEINQDNNQDNNQDCNLDSEPIESPFRDRVFTKEEIIYCESKKVSRYESYAARFAAKEAVAKAFGTGIGQNMGWKDIEIKNDAAGKPHVILIGPAAAHSESINAKGISISLSHCRTYAVAYAVIEI